MNDTPSNDETRLQRLERLTEALGVQLHVMERAIWTLVLTHPHPESFARTFAEATERTTAVHLNDEKVSDEVRERSHRLAMDLVGLARAAADQQRAQATTPRPPSA